MKALVHFVPPASGTLGLTQAGSQAPAQPGTLSHPFMYRVETGFYDLFIVILNKAKPLAGALVELDVEIVQAYYPEHCGNPRVPPFIKGINRDILFYLPLLRL